MTPDPKDKVLVVGKATPSDIDILKALGRGAEVVTVDGVVGMEPTKPVTFEGLQNMLRIKRDADLDLARAGLLAVKTQPITGGSRSGQRRNEPCHCRSGKKWKKCCGRAGAMDLSAQGGRQA